MQQERQERIKIAILKNALKLAGEAGWNAELLRTASLNAGYDPAMGGLLFLDGAVDALALLHQQLDKKMVHGISRKLAGNVRVSEKIYQLLCMRFELCAAHKEAIVRGMHFLALPHNLSHGLKIALNTADAIWNTAAAGDTDHNYYSKRTLLAGVYLSSQLYWSTDKTAGNAATMAFIRRRLDDTAMLGDIIKKVAKLPKIYRR